MSFYDMYPMGGMSVGGFPIGGGGTKESAAKGRAKQIANIVALAQQGLTPQQIAQEYATRFPTAKKAPMTAEQRAQRRNESIVERALAIQEGTYSPKARRPAGQFSTQKSALLKRMKAGRPNADGTAKFDVNALAQVSDALATLGYGIYNMETGGDWASDLMKGFSIPLQMAGQVAQTAAPFLPFFM
jgi:hypothetical protein